MKRQFYAVSWGYVALSACAGMVVSCALGRADTAVSTNAARIAVEKAIPLIEKSSAFTLQERACFTCHHGAHPAMAITEAWSRGFKIHKGNLDDQLERAYRELVNDEPRFKEGFSVSKTADGPGHSLWMLDLNGWQADPIADAAVGFFLMENKELDHWEPPMRRPPTVGSAFTTTFLVLRALKHHGAPAQRERIAERIATAKIWLSATPGGDETEDKVYRLRGLHLFGADGADFRDAASRLLRTQREDGGWGQTGTLGSDAYATGTALAALCDTGALTPRDAAYQRGADFLLRTQFDDGSWRVHKRTHAVQPFFHSEFPHGDDQFISISATCWAAYALAKLFPLTAEATKGKYLAPRPFIRARLQSGGAGEPVKFTTEQLAFFREKIEPVLRERCYKCHSAGAEKLKGDLYLDTRGGVLSGGASGPALRPGDAEHSLLVRSLEGDNTELMPPKKKLPPAVITDFKKWIEMGAPDPRPERKAASLPSVK